MNLDENMFFKRIVARLKKEMPAGSGGQGPAGPKGDTGAPGAAGRDGKDGAVGSQGLPGKDGVAGPSGAAGSKGDTGAAGRDGVDGRNGVDGARGPAGVSGLQAIRAQTTAAGVYTWTFPTPFAAGVVPVVSLALEDSTAGVLTGVRITALSNTSVTVLTSRSAGVTVAGIAVLGAAVGVQVYVHLKAVAPT